MWAQKEFDNRYLLKLNGCAPKSLHSLDQNLPLPLRYHKSPCTPQIYLRMVHNFPPLPVNNTVHLNLSLLGPRSGTTGQLISLVLLLFGPVRGPLRRMRTPHFPHFPHLSPLLLPTFRIRPRPPLFPSRTPARGPPNPRNTPLLYHPPPQNLPYGFLCFDLHR